MLFFKKRNKQVYMATFEKRCPCCSRKFKATYPASNPYLYQEAKDVVNSHYNVHRFFCVESANMGQTA